MKKILKSCRKFWWGGYEDYKSYITRNDEELVIKKRLEDAVFLDIYGYKVFSQNDEDGIIAEVFKRIGTTNKTFIEFGASNGLENNSHYLLHQNWSGGWIEGSKKSYRELVHNFQNSIKENRLKVVNAFINEENINELIKRMNITGVIDLLSIDIDGNDYWVWDAITCINPRVVIIEYNAKFPPDSEWIMKYDKNHIWENDDNQGASLKSMELLGKRKGYQLVGTNFSGVNAFFVKKELAEGKFPIPATSENLYNPFRAKCLKYISGHPSKKYTG